MVDFKADERLNTLNHSCAHVMAQAVKHLYPHAKFWVGPVVKEGFYYDIDLGDDVVNDDVIAAIEKEMKKICKEGKKIYRREVTKAEALEREYEQKKAQLEKEYNDLKAAIEPELVETITEVFRKITYTVAEDNKEIIIGLINGVMKNSDISNEFVIRVSPDDYRFLVNNQGKIYCAVSKEVNMDIVEDAAMKKNQCIIESDTGVYDCSLDIELNNLIRDIKLLSCTQ